MIRVQLFPQGDNTQRMYENLMPVGASLAGDNTNRDRASNQLIQFFLRAFFKVVPALLPRGPALGRGFLLDGKVGAQTITGIKRFQEFNRKEGHPIILDSRVSVATDPSGIPGTGGVRWTIHFLNFFYIARSGKSDFEELFDNSEIKGEAPELAAELLAAEQELRS